MPQGFVPTRAEQRVIEEWRDVCETRGHEIDPNDEHDWYSLSIGYLMARLIGIPTDRLIDLALHCRYDLEIG